MWQWLPLSASYFLLVSLNPTFSFINRCQLQIGTSHGHLPSTSTRIKSRAPAAADLQHPLKEVQSGEQKRGTLCLGKQGIGRTGLQIDTFRSWFYEPSSFISSRKALNFFFCFCFFWLAETFCKNICLSACTPPSPKSHMYWPSTSLCGAVSQGCLKCYFCIYIPHLAPNKT